MMCRQGGAGPAQVRAAALQRGDEQPDAGLLGHGGAPRLRPGAAAARYGDRQHRHRQGLQ